LGASLIDQWISACLAPLAVWLLVSGLDDFFLDLVWLYDWVSRRFRRAAPAADEREYPERLTAIFVPLWHEHAVIGQMVEHNLAAIRYGPYELFLGTYPNDEPTIEAVRELAARFPRVHLAVCPHSGPTSKADCLNWTYQHMLIEEERRAVRFETIVVHDAEDLIHPEELRIVDGFTGTYAMIQIPVLPLATPLRRFTHGIYCDEFAEYQTKDIPARQRLGGFIPSNGVGTGYARWAIEKLAATSNNRVFEPDCLTEDYENGLRLHKLGCPQLFVPIRFESGRPVATREYFPQRFSHALRQRTRWVTGNALQSWERNGWRASPRQLYWYWRDRKGLAGNPISVLANAILLYGLASWLFSRWSGTEWAMGRLANRWETWSLFCATLSLNLMQLGVRTGCVARIYGWKFASGVPLRIFWANWINFLATVRALGQYLGARVRGQPLVWFKTEHTYPSRLALQTYKRRLGEILITARRISEPVLRGALASKPPGRRLGEHLVALGHLTEEDVYEALGSQQSIPVETLHPAEIPVWVARSLPARFIRRWKVIPFRIAAGRIYVASDELPAEDLHTELRRLTKLEVNYRLVTPVRLRELINKLL
jgi:bacteriophage N4 adsorption protein B